MRTFHGFRTFLCASALVGAGCGVNSPKENHQVLLSGVANAVSLEAIGGDGNHGALSIQNPLGRSFELVDLRTGKRRSAQIPPNTLRVVSLGANSEKWLVSGKGWCALVNPMSGEVQSKLTFDDQNTVALSADTAASQVLAANKDKVFLASILGDSQTVLLQSERIQNASLRPEGDIAAIMLNDAVILFDVESGKRFTEARNLVAVKKAIGVFWLEGNRVGIKDDKGLRLCDITKGTLDQSDIMQEPTPLTLTGPGV